MTDRPPNGNPAVCSSPVVVVTEPNRTPLVLVIHESLVIGRDSDGLILLDSRLSRRHLRLDPIGGALWVTDMGSLNGTTVDGRPLTGPHLLLPGQVVAIGSCRVKLHGPPADPASAGL